MESQGAEIVDTEIHESETVPVMEEVMGGNKKNVSSVKESSGQKTDLKKDESGLIASNLMSTDIE